MQNLVSALEYAKAALLEMTKMGLTEERYIFALSNFVIENFGLNKEQAIFLIETAAEQI